MVRMSYDELKKEITRVLTAHGVDGEKAALTAGIYAENSLVGVYSHGLNLFVNTMHFITSGSTDVKAEPERVSGFGALERWDGHMGIGPYNAYTCAMRAVELARQHGVGMVALRNNNHWGRAGKYSGLVADNGMLGICATNGTSCMATWGGLTSRIGNNPVSMAVPHAGGNIAVDMAFSQFSNGQLNNHKTAGQQLPVAGGFTADGTMTTDPATVLETKKHLPVGFWKGVAFATLTNLIVAIAAEGNTTRDMDELGADKAISQVYCAVNFEALGGADYAKTVTEETIAYITDTELAPGFSSVRYPGQSLVDTRAANLKDGIPLQEDMWQRLLQF